MINQELYQNIYKRKSIRRYDLTPLPESVLMEVKAFAESAVPLIDDIKYEFTYLSAGDVKNLLPIKAPHYICLYSEAKPNYLMNAGYLLQQIDLYLSHKALGSCWLGMAKPSKQVALQQNGLDFVIMLAFGAPNEPVHRERPDDFKRKLTQEMSSVTGHDALVEAVRLAPSASNSQPWFVSGTPEGLILSRERLNMLRGALYGKMNQIDIGIALLHLDMAVRHHGRQAIYSFSPQDIPGEVPQGYEFMVRVETKAIDE